MFSSSVMRLFSLSLLAAPAWTQLIGPVGPTTPLHLKKHKCNILDYGAIADNKTDIAPAVHLAFELCVKPHTGRRLYVPHGDYLLNQTIDLVNGTNWAFQIDGLITGAYGGNYYTDDLILIENRMSTVPRSLTRH